MAIEITANTGNIPVSVSTEYDVSDEQIVIETPPESVESSNSDYDDDSLTSDCEESEVIEDIEIVGAPYTRNDPYVKKEKPAREITYGTTQVAQMLGVTPQTVRNYIKDYNEYLEIEIVQAGSTERAQFTKSDVETLRELMRVKEENNYTTDQMREYIADPKHVGYVPESKKMDKTVELLIETVRRMLLENTQTCTNLIASQDNTYSKAVEELSAIVQNQNEQIEGLKGALEEQRKSIDSLTHGTTELQKREISMIEAKSQETIASIKSENNVKLKELEQQKDAEIKLLKEQKESEIAALTKEKSLKIDELETDIIRLKNEISKSQSSIDSLSDKNAALQKAAKDNTDKAESDNAMIAMLSKKNEELYAELKELKEGASKRKKLFGIF